MGKWLLKRPERIDIRNIVFCPLSAYGIAAQQKLKQIKILSNVLQYVQYHCCPHW